MPANSDRHKHLYLEQLENGLLKLESAKAIGVNYATVWRWRKSDPDFNAACEAAEYTAVVRVEDALYMAALDGNVTAQQVILYNRAPDRWRDRRNVAVSGPDGGPIRIVQWRELLQEEESGKAGPSSGSSPGS